MRQLGSLAENFQSGYKFYCGTLPNFELQYCKQWVDEMYVRLLLPEPERLLHKLHGALVVLVPVDNNNRFFLFLRLSPSQGSVATT